MIDTISKWHPNCKQETGVDVSQATAAELIRELDEGIAAKDWAMWAQEVRAALVAAERNALALSCVRDRLENDGYGLWLPELCVQRLGETEESQPDIPLDQVVEALLGLRDLSEDRSALMPASQ